jgi:hypothetical protein
VVTEDGSAAQRIPASGTIPLVVPAESEDGDSPETPPA